MPLVLLSVINDQSHQLYSIPTDYRVQVVQKICITQTT